MNKKKVKFLKEFSSIRRGGEFPYYFNTFSILRQWIEIIEAEVSDLPTKDKSLLFWDEG